MGRDVWYRFWDTCITTAGSFYARVNYIHYNPVRHGLVDTPEAYAFSSYRLWLQAEELDLGEIEDAHPWNLLDLE